MTYVYKKLDDGRYECIKCQEIKNNQSTMHYHMLAHEGKSPYKCKHCHKSFAQKSALEIHKSSKHEKNMKFVCPSKGCSYECSTKANCRIHYIRKHAGLVPLTTEETCRGCQKTFKSDPAYFYHAATCHTFDVTIRQELIKII
jgi:KRAB domain-containing zinc finger protein